MDNELFERVQVCVAYDLIGQGEMVRYEDMNITDKTRYTKQCNRLYHACMVVASDRNYIYERYDEITGRRPIKTEDEFEMSELVSYYA
jgi:hypothetical protein